MAIRNKNVCIKVDKNYFESFFEPERKRLEKKLGVSFTQPKFTAFLARSGATLNYPKMNNMFAPKKKRGGNFGFNLGL